VLWTLNNIGVTLANKACFAVVSFPYPYTLTAIHMAICTAASQWIFYSLRGTNSNKSNSSSTNSSSWLVQLLGEELRQPKYLDAAGRRVIWAFSVIFSLNIAFGNVSLKYVSVNFNQIMRSLVPVLTLWCSLYCLPHRKAISLPRQRAVWPVVLGVALAGAGDRYAVTAIGLVSTVLSVVLASLKVVASSELLTGTRKLHPVQLLALMAPAALLQCAVLAVLTGELGDIALRWNGELNPLTSGDWKPVSVLLLSGVLAFSLNISALQAYRLTSPLTCCIAAAVKQVLMIVIGTLVFQTAVSPMNGTGIVVVLVGSAYYSYISVQESTVAAVAAQGSDTEKSANLLPVVQQGGGVETTEVPESEMESRSLLAAIDEDSTTSEPPTEHVRSTGVVSRYFTSLNNNGSSSNAV